MKTTELPSPAASPRGPGAAVRAFPAEAVRRIVDRFTYPAERPVVTLLLYYSLLFLIGAALGWFVPGAGAMISGERLAQLGAAKGLQDLVPGPAFAWNISFSMALSMVGAFVLMLPSSWVYMATRQRKGFDQQVVQTFIVLAVAVAGVIIIARNSVALAFSLAGVVGAVRFRNTLPETRDTLYIFLAIGVGLASGVEALTAAAVLSMVFNFIVLIMDRGNYGSCALGTDPRRLLVGAATATPEKKAKDFTAVLVVRVSDADAARASVEAILDGEVSRWRLAEVETTRKGKGVLKYLIRLGKRVEAANLEDALIAAGGPSVIGARIH